MIHRSSKVTICAAPAMVVNRWMLMAYLFQKVEVKMKPKVKAEKPGMEPKAKAVNLKKDQEMAKNLRESQMTTMVSLMS